MANYTIAEYAKLHDMKPDTLRGLVRRHEPSITRQRDRACKESDCDRLVAVYKGTDLDLVIGNKVTVTIQEFSEIYGINIHTCHSRFKRIKNKPEVVSRQKMITGGYGHASYRLKDLEQISYKTRSALSVDKTDYEAKEPPIFVDTSSVRDFYLRREFAAMNNLVAASSRCYQ